MATKLTLARLESLLFINTDREHKEGKNQNSLRPKDIEKITHVYHDHLEVPKYSREVSWSELERKDSIRSRLNV